MRQPPLLQPPPLSMYVHMPWCVVKCPYCDFNSHALKGELPQQAYVDALLKDLELDLAHIWGRTVHSIFIGGGTPSLFEASAIDQLLAGIGARVNLSPTAEITLEANPGTVEHDRFEAYRAAGVNRVSLGIQSLNNAHLKTLGRIHGADEARNAVEAVKSAGFERINLDLMWGLPQQTVAMMEDDLLGVLAFETGHVSHYQLTIEPNTVFAAKPPPLPDEDTIIEMGDRAAALFGDAQYAPYEISAWARPGHEARHNQNYWRFGDYVGIGAGAHGKLTLAHDNRIIRKRRKQVPHSYLTAAQDGSFIAEQADVSNPNRAFEYFLNRFRLAEPIDYDEFETRTGLSRQTIAPALEKAASLGLVTLTDRFIVRTSDGARYLNDLQQLFLDASTEQ